MISIFLMLVWTAVSVIASQLLVGKLMLWLLGAEQFVQPVWMAIYSALSYVVALGLVVLLPNTLAKKRRCQIDLSADRTELGLREWPTWTDIGLAPVGFIAYLLLAAGLTALFSNFPWFDPNEAQDLGFSFYVAGFDRMVAFITLVVVAPIAEEVIFRGWLYGKIREKFSATVSEAWSVVFSMLLVSVLFGAVHLQWNVGVDVFVLSLVLCGLREITGTIYSGIILHMLKNGIAFFLLYVLGMGLG